MRKQLNCPKCGNNETYIDEELLKTLLELYCSVCGYKIIGDNPIV